MKVQQCVVVTCNVYYLMLYSALPPKYAEPMKLPSYEQAERTKVGYSSSWLIDKEKILYGLHLYCKNVNVLSVSFPSHKQQCYVASMLSMVAIHHYYIYHTILPLHIINS